MELENFFWSDAFCFYFSNRNELMRASFASLCKRQKKFQCEILFCINQVCKLHQQYPVFLSNPTARIKTDVNKIIRSVNQRSGQTIMKPIVGEFKPEYFWETVKIHKIRIHCVSSIHRSPPLYKKLQKTIKQNKSPYLPAKFHTNSYDEFLQILRSCRSNGKLSCFDVKSLFASVPITSNTREIFCQNFYQNRTILSSPFTEATVCKLSLACTSGCNLS